MPAVIAMAPNKSQMLVFVPPHPLIGHWLATLRAEFTPTPVFRSAMAELGRILVYELARDWLPTQEVDLQTPMGPADGTIIDMSRPVKVVPILRAGLVPLEQISTVLPSYETYHVGLVRDEETLQPREYLNKLPASFGPEDRILVSDPMLATGGTIMHVLQDIVSRGASPSMIRVLAITVAPPALKQLSEKYPGLHVYTACIDAELNDQGYIVPGLGDAGDRAFGTQ